MWATSVIFNTLSGVNYHPLVEFSPNLGPMLWFLKYFRRIFLQKWRF
jgi:hypothetical protein